MERRAAEPGTDDTIPGKTLASRRVANAACTVGDDTVTPSALRPAPRARCQRHQIEPDDRVSMHGVFISIFGAAC